MSNDDLYGVVDLGTNTFHLLVGRVGPHGIEEVVRERHFVRVAGEGITTIGAASYARAIAAAQSVGRALAQQPTAKVVAFGTAAFRTASNGPELRKELSSIMGIDIEIIDGQREAELIAKGVLAAALLPDRRYLVMDIGGGSVEFILLQHGQTLYAESFPIGAQVLKSRFHVREPFGKTEFDPQPQLLQDYLKEVLRPLLEVLGTSSFYLLGASGTFDVLGEQFGRALSHNLQEISGVNIRAFYREVMKMTEEERFSDTRIPSDRAEMLAVALALIEYVLVHGAQTEVFACAYALKEGALIELSAASPA